MAKRHLPDGTGIREVRNRALADQPPWCIWGSFETGRFRTGKVETGRSLYGVSWAVSELAGSKHESLSNVTPADAYFGRASAIIKQRERIKRQTIEHRRLQHRKLAA